MRHCLAIAWFLVTTNTVLLAGDWTPNSLTNIEVPRVFRAGRTQSLIPQDSSAARKPSIFELKTEVPESSDLVEFVAPISTSELYIEEEEDQPTGVVKIGYDDTFVDEPPESNFPRLDSEPRPLTQAIPLDGALRDADEKKSDKEPHLSGSRSSLGWIAGANDRLGMVELDVLPTSLTQYDPTKSNIFFPDVTFGAKWLNGPNITDLPPQLFNILLNFGAGIDINNRLAIDGMISPGWYTDFSNKGVDAFRLPWHFVTYHKMDDDWRWVLGVTDLSRKDIRYLPVVGMVYAPTGGDVRLDLVFPKPRVAWRYAQAGQIEQWFYINGELGGGSWAISRADRSYDTVTYRDYRLIAGLETRHEDGAASRIEVGWIFDRSVQYRSDIGNYSPQDSLMIRVSSDY